MRGLPPGALGAAPEQAHHGGKREDGVATLRTGASGRAALREQYSVPRAGLFQQRPQLPERFRQTRYVVLPERPCAHQHHAAVLLS